jgi:hypothetical protein
MKNDGSNAVDPARRKGVGLFVHLPLPVTRIFRIGESSARPPSGGFAKTL